MIRYLGQNGLEILSFVLSIVFLFGILSDLGLDSIVVREIIRHPENENQILGSTFTLKFVGSLLAIALAFSLGWVFVRDIDVVMLIFIMSLQLIFKSFDTVDYYFQAHVQSKYSVYSKLISLSATTFFCLLFVYFRKSLIWFTAIVPVEIAIAGLALFLFYVNISRRYASWSVSFDIIKNLLRKAWPLILSGISISIYMRVDQIMIRQLLGDARWDFIRRGSLVRRYFIPMVIMSSVFPAIVSSKMNPKIYIIVVCNLFRDSFMDGGYCRRFISLTKFILVGFLGRICLPQEFLPYMLGRVFVYLGVAGQGG